MANKLHTKNQSITTNKSVVFTSDKSQIVFLEVWNISEKESLITVNNESYTLGVAPITEDAHHFRKFNVVENETIELSCEKNNVLEFNICL